ncbi:unnamed protein product, partial [Mesorhabditis belari]|uniref:Rubicon Homology domain-containing protein n=1 Tax=Mesorhabditis belari TaxID=2138241 RepID=A0AAF3J2J7_9BILA
MKMKGLMERFLTRNIREPPENGHQYSKIDVDTIPFISLHEHTDEADTFADSLSHKLDINDTASINTETQSDGSSIITRSRRRTSTFLPFYEDPNAIKPEFNCFPQNSDLPFWKETQRRIFSWTTGDDDNQISPETEKSNQMIYMAGLVDAMLEEARWRCQVASDPETAELLAEIDADYRCGLITSPNNLSGTSDLTLTEEREEDEVRATVVDNGTFYINRNPNSSKSVTSVRSSTCGVDDVVLKRDVGMTTSDLVTQAIECFISRNEVSDAHVKKWMNDVLAMPEKLLSDDSTTTNFDPPTLNKLCDIWIFNLHPTHNIKDLLDEQGWRCADCGKKITGEYTKRVRYCDYYGLLFCQCCHQGAKMKIPARVLHLWSFKEMPVSDKAFAFISQTHNQPVIHIRHLAPKLIERIRILRTVITLREKISHMWNYIQTCMDAEETVTRIGNLRSMFSSLDRHLLCEESDLFSLSDLEKVYNGELVNLLEPIVQYGKCHIEKCEKCRAQAFVCSLCNNDSDLLFPFQMERVARCEQCGSLTHMKCDVKRRKAEQSCPKCTRIDQARKLDDYTKELDTTTTSHHQRSRRSRSVNSKKRKNIQLLI